MISSSLTLILTEEKAPYITLAAVGYRRFRTSSNISPGAASRLPS
jgi:hypothetical protein